MLGLLLTDDAQVAGSVRCTVCGVQAAEIEFVFEPDPDGGYHAYAPEFPGLHTEGDTLEEAVSNAEEALALYVEGLREEGRALDMGVVRRTLSLPA
jgi:predicted RNase H-like HicB family nuclease